MLQESESSAREVDASRRPPGVLCSQKGNWSVQFHVRGAANAV